MTIQTVADATVQLNLGGEPVGSGFRFIQDDIVITNAHVFPQMDVDVPIAAVTKSFDDVRLELVYVSPPPRAGGHDFAILQSASALLDDGPVLQPAHEDPRRGDKVLFAGHPFDISETLVHEAIVSAPSDRGFYLDGSVNFRNSGGPIVEEATGDVVGILTESRVYRDAELAELKNDLLGVQQQLLRMGEVSAASINRVSIGEVATNAMLTIQNVIDLLAENISSGIGVGYSIDPVCEQLTELGGRD